jgi:hypothetical protein
LRKADAFGVCLHTPVLATLFHIGLASALFVTGFQPFLALRLTGQENPFHTASMLLLVWKLYLLDRALEHPEDASLHEGNAAAFLRRFPRSFSSLFGVLAAGQLALVLLAPELLGAIALSVVVSMFYFVKVPLLAKRAKQLPYFKCFYLSACALVVVGAFTPGMWGCLTARGLTAVCLSFLLFFLNFSLYDIKDVEGDTRANIKTFAAALPLQLFLALHLCLALALAGASLALLQGGAGGVLAAVFVFHAAVSLWLRQRPFSAALCGVIDGGYGLILGAGTWLLLRH